MATRKTIASTPAEASAKPVGKPPNRAMGILNRVLQISMPELARGQRMPLSSLPRPKGLG